MMPRRTRSARIFPPSDAIILVRLFTTRFSLTLRHSTSQFHSSPRSKLSKSVVDDFLLQDDKQGFSSFFSRLSKYINNMTVTIKDAVKLTAYVTSDATKNSEITSKEDMMASPERTSPYNPDNTVRNPAFATQLLTRCSSDGTFFCRCHSTRRSTTSEVVLPKSRKGIIRVVGKREVLVIDTIPAEEIMGNRIDEIISKIVLRMQRLSDEKHKTMKTTTAIARGEK